MICSLANFYITWNQHVSYCIPIHATWKAFLVTFELLKKYNCSEMKSQTFFTFKKCPKVTYLKTFLVDVYFSVKICNHEWNFFFQNLSLRASKKRQQSRSGVETNFNWEILLNKKEVEVTRGLPLKTTSATWWSFDSKNLCTSSVPKKSPIALWKALWKFVTLRNTNNIDKISWLN